MLDFDSRPTPELEALLDNYVATRDDPGLRRGAVLDGERTPALGITPGGAIATVTAVPLLDRAIATIAAILRRRRGEAAPKSAP